MNSFEKLNILCSGACFKRSRHTTRLLSAGGRLSHTQTLWLVDKVDKSIKYKLYSYDGNNQVTQKISL